MHTIALSSIALLVFATVIPFDFGFSPFNDAAPFVMLSLFGAGLAALYFRQEALMKASFLGVAVIAMMIRSSVLAPADQVDVLPLSSENKFSKPFSLSQYSTSNLMVNNEPQLATIIADDADLVAIQGLTPDWSDLLTTELSEKYPFQYHFEDIGVHGIGLFSNQALGDISSFEIADVLQIKACISGSATFPEANIIAIQTTPPVNSNSYQLMRTQLSSIAEMVANISRPVIVIGDFNSMPWSNELNEFQKVADLSDSRKSQFPTYHAGSPHLFDRPVEHIFYSKDLSCLNFESQRVGSSYIGCSAIFQLQPEGSILVAN